MTIGTRKQTEARFELLLSYVLRAGVLASAVVVALGGVGYLAEHGQEPRDHKVFRGEPAELRHPTMILGAAIQFESSATIQFGLLLLIGTPVARVLLSVIGFLRERDFTYVGFTLVVLAVLLSSLFFGQ